MSNRRMGKSGSTGGSTRGVPRIEFQEHQLENGLHVVLHEDHTAPVVTTHVLYAVGSKNERPQRTGFAHLFEHMLFQGSEHVADDEHFALIQQRGGVANGSTWFDRTVYFETLPAKELELALWLESDRMGYFEAGITQEKLDNQRDVVKNERLWRVDNQPYGTWLERALELVFPPEFPYHWPVIGYMEDLDRASVDDVKQFFRTFYRPNNAVLCVAGDIEPKKALAQVERYFSEIPRGDDPPELITHWQPLQTERRVQIEDDVQLARVYAVYPIPPYGSDAYYRLDMASEVLGAGRSSRLQRRLVHETSLATDVTAWTLNTLEAGLFAVVATASPDTEPERLEAALDEEVEKLRLTPPADEEMQRTHNRIDTLYMGMLEANQSKAELLNMYWLAYNDPGRINTELDRYHRVTPEQVQEEASRFLQPSNRALLRYVPRRKLASVATGVKSPDRSQAPPSGSIRRFTLPEVVRTELPSGLRLVVAPTSRVPKVAARLILDAGAMRDPMGMEGIAQLTADLLDEGTSDHSALELAETIDGLGASFGCDAGSDRADVMVDVLARNFDAAMGLLTEVVRRPSFEQRELERVRQEQLSRILQSQDNPGRLANRTFLGEVYGDHPYGHSVDGLRETVAATDRDAVLQFYGSHYGPAGATLIVAGAMDPAEVETIVSRHLGDWQGTSPEDKIGDAEQAETETSIYLIDKPGAPQSELRVGHLGMRRNDEDWIPAQVMNAILGGKFTSRINLNLREEHGYTYGARSSFDGRLAMGSFAVSSAVNAQSTAPAVIEILKELRRIREQPVDVSELEDTQSYLSGVFPLKFETARDLVLRLTTLELYDLPRDTFERYIDAVAAVTRDDLLRVAQRLIRPDTARIVVVGPAESIEAGLAEIAPVKRPDQG